ncbi:HypC/HybG/HupF family hydrogenase formation chaperone [Clostridium ganghwense]|uniref:HypC/HybG/HupF family hydrogenase formation chaperone n=1 Tax=Clostridium ganghwense TaxID=312089 RepID=A0ABT4CVE3_9CLOT|nr:HypC/HybG/HupF family hydrogenase formation chaperone [Clostridium ganghwense]MCY6372031.1 HypC/HybG/HupF family hydrogenase formation chaperone [Clostridium ganghwense]
MCLAICGEIKNLDLPFAVVNIKGVETCVNVQLIEEPLMGDYVLIHAGFAIEKIDKDYFDYLDNIFEEMLKEDDEL